MSTNIDQLLAGFQEECWYDAEAFTLEAVPGMGIGAIAKRDLQPGETLFRIPLNKILSSYSSELAKLLPAWDDLEGGWTQLILAMMWETSRGEASPWSWYLKSMPTTFDTPMFWTDKEKEWLSGTSIQDRIGREEAEALYMEKIAPLLVQHSDLFPEPYFSLDAFHMHGSRILSRSFTMEASILGADEDDEIVAMVPMADMLNAASGLDNAHLEFHDDAAMITTEFIPQGSQIYNTYSAPPNAELLRKYGHVDVLPLPYEDWPYGNPEDDVDIDGASVVKAAGGDDTRVDWWLDAGQDDLFSVTLEGIDPELISFCRILTSDADWKRAKKSGPPAGRLDKLGDRGVEVLERVLRDRMARYEGSLQSDIKTANERTGRERMAAIVRIGERRALQKGLEQIQKPNKKQRMH